jgi:hypothetical protein
MSEKKPAPISRVRVGGVNGAIWKNEGEQGRVFLTATFQRTYKDKDGTLKNSESFGATALLELAKCADAAHTRMLKLYADMPRGQEAEETPDEDLAA